MRLASLLILLTASAALADTRGHFAGICEPSAGAFLSATRFAVASDESNVIRIYDLRSPDPVAALDLRGAAFTGHDKSDIEGAARLGDVVYWTASQSESGKGSDKKRKTVFQTAIIATDAGPALDWRGSLREDLKPQILDRAGVDSDRLNLEGLAATPQGDLLFGLRDLVQGKALVVPMKNAAAVLGTPPAAAEFGAAIRLDLGGRGIRSLDRVGDRYLIVAGKDKDSDRVGPAVFWWDGRGDTAPKPWAKQPDFTGMDPEAALVLPDESAVLFVSDDGDRCPKADEHVLSDQRGFTTLTVPLND